MEASLVYSESQDSQDYTEKPCLEKTKPNKQKTQKTKKTTLTKEIKKAYVLVGLPGS